MRTASEMDFEVQPTEALDFVIDQVGEALHTIRTITGEETVSVKVFLEVETR